MAGRGPAPKPADQRRNRNKKERGDWQGILAPSTSVPPMPERGEERGDWSDRTARAWNAWWSDPASTQWSPSDIELVEHLADVMEEWVRDPGTAGRAGEVRQLRDVLGLTPKGRQDRRWKIAEPEVVDLDDKRPSAAARMEKLRAREAAAPAKTA